MTIKFLEKDLECICSRWISH